MYIISSHFSTFCFMELIDLCTERLICDTRKYRREQLDSIRAIERLGRFTAFLYKRRIVQVV